MAKRAGSTSRTKRAGKRRSSHTDGRATPRLARTAAPSRLPSTNGEEIFDEVCRRVIADTARQVLREGSALGAELWMSEVLGTGWRMPLIGEPDTMSMLGRRLVTVAARRGVDGELTLRALAAVGSESLRRRAGRELSLRHAKSSAAPGWLEEVGAAEGTTAFMGCDVYGDQDVIMIGFRYPSGDDHFTCVLVDHVLGDIAKDAWVGSGTVGELLSKWPESEDIDFLEVPVGDAARRMLDAVEWSEAIIDATVSPDFRDYVALLRARGERFAGDAVAPQVWPTSRREQVVSDFLASPAGECYAHDGHAWFILDALVDYRCEQVGDALRWSPGATELFLMDFVPRKLTATDETLGMASDVLRAWIPWAGCLAGLTAGQTSKTLAVIDELGSRPVAALTDSDNWGPAKTIAMRMLAEGVDMSDPKAVEAWLGTQQLAGGQNRRVT